jgi:penicillin-binding protein 1A
MAGKSKSGKRIEPSFEGGKRARDGDLRADPRDRVSRTASKSSRSTKAPAKPRSSRRSRGSGGGIIGFMRRAIWRCWHRPLLRIAYAERRELGDA